ncbi:Fungalysin metallopeptidase-domain-containing protein [Halteromyces radiatus]|uniref:Fungalysin metallopeptidase-domain-containing protein n=1 Tax=Halteromyces radiatus TaxID=101107 RepID=UPI002220FBBD|nr:Fungalysin metallopeptidase-domain-containing protein [Halteromyces radiatus]KAI8093283.1 Fungalysin metallopeptidase-domain-containing protein [Halteromyces radiatus]
MKYPISSAIGLFLGISQVIAASLPLHSEQQELVPNFGPDGIHREYIADTTIPSSYQAALTGQIEPVQAALDFVHSRLTSSEFIVHSSYKSDLNGVTHVHLRQVVKGLQVLNANINVNVLPNGQILSYGDSFAKSHIKIQKLFSPTSFFQQVQSGLAQIILGSNRSLKQSDQRFSEEAAKVEEQYNFVKGHNLISPNEAVVALLDFVKPKLPDPSIASKLRPDDLTPTHSLRPHDDDGNGEPTLQFEGVPFSLNPVRVRRAYVQQNNGDLALVWDVEMELEDNWYSGQVHAFDGTMVSLIDWVHESGPVDTYYNVIPFGANDPSDSDQQLIKNPYDLFASPEGWHSQGGYSGKGQNQIFNVTVGNNVYAHTNPDGGYNWENNYRPQGHTGGESGDALVFDYKARFDVDEPETYEDAAVTNLFYWCNTAHDLFHRYGFDEKAGNFQQDNLGRGRAKDQQVDDGEGDAVVANAQDGSGRDNANFATPPDGQHGKMRMYVWDQTSPMRDGDFESGIVIHEYTHGVSNRLTGGPKNSNCLGYGEAGGMGEGWGDFVATIIRMKPEYKRDIDFGMGNWANGGEGIRKYKYSTSQSTNPSTYRIMDRFDYWGVHAKGEVWAEMLYEVYWNLVDKHGFTPDWLPPATVTTTNNRGIPIMSDEDIQNAKNHIISHGNTLALQLVLDGMKLQPCSPSFTDARDAILDADKALTGGANYCDIYAGFAKRGLGVKAKLAKQGWIEQRKESFDVPPQCR